MTLHFALPFGLGALLFFAWIFQVNEVVTHGAHWTLGDWLINFEGGLVRRGLVGALLLEVAKVTQPWGLGLAPLTLFCQGALYTWLLVLVLRLYRKGPTSFLSIMLLCSPAFLLFPVYDPRGGFRKEIFDLVGFCHSSSKNAQGKKTIGSLVTSLLVFVLSAFSHELTAFTLPFFGMALWKLYQEKALTLSQASWLGLGYLILGVLALGFAWRYPGNHTVSLQICASITAQGISPEVCRGSIDWLQFNAEFGKEFVAQKLLSYLKYYPFLAVLALIPVFASPWMKRRENVLLMLVGALFLSPLFVIALDWGRWVYLYVSLLTLLILGEAQPHRTENQWEVAQVHRKHWSIWVMGALYLSTWHLPHCCAERMGFGMMEIFWKAIRAFLHALK